MKTVVKEQWRHGDHAFAIFAKCEYYRRVGRVSAGRGKDFTHIISRKTLLEAARELAGSMAGVSTWFSVARKAQWGSLEDVKKTYSSADGVPVGKKVYTVFNIGGN